MEGHPPEYGHDAAPIRGAPGVFPRTPAASDELAGGPLLVALNRANTLVAVEARNGAVTGAGAMLAERVAAELGVGLEFRFYAGAAAMLDAVGRNGWHVALMAPDAARSNVLHFTAAYLELRATLRVAADAGIVDMDDANRPEVAIASVTGAAFDARLRERLPRARIVACPTPADAVRMLLSGAVFAVAGIRGLVDVPSDDLRRTRMLDDDFAVIPQALAIPLRHVAIAAVCDRIVARSRPTPPS